MSGMAQEKVGYVFNRGVRRQVILDLMVGLVAAEALNAIQAERVIKVWDNALLARRREALLRVGRFVSRDVAMATAASQRSGGRRSRNHGRVGSATGAGADVYAGGASRVSRRQEIRYPVFVPNEDITTKMWAKLAALVARHGAARDLGMHSRLGPGNPIPLCDRELPPPLVQTLMNYGSLEHRVA